MRGITGTTPSGATRLSFAQKAIATGMSVVLAFGLSPIGQAPAYADEALQTQSTELQPQADPATTTFKAEASILNSEGKISAAENIYNGGDQVFYVVVKDTLDGLVDTDEYDVEVLDSDGAEVENCAEAAKASDPVGAKGGYKITLVDADKYTVTATPKPNSSYKATSSAASIEIKTLDINKLQGSEFKAGALTYTGSDLTPTFTVAAKTTKKATDPTYDLKQDVDYKVKVNGMVDAGTYTVTLEGLGSCEGSSTTVPVTVSQATLLTAGDVEPDASATLNNAAIEGATDVARDGYVATVNVPYNKVADPIELTYRLNGDESAKKVTLEEDEDYSVEYFEFDSNKKDAPSETAIDPSKISTKTKYWAVIRVLEGSTNFMTQEGGATNPQVITALCTVGINSTLESFVDHVVLADGSYLAGTDASASKAGATFYDKEGNDVTDLVGEHFSFVTEKAKGPEGDDSDYGILSTNTYNSAALSEGDKGVPVGAGQYYTYITGDQGAENAWYNKGEGVIAYYTVNPSTAGEGTAVGQLSVTVSNAAYKQNDYVEPTTTVGMYLTKGGVPAEIAATEMEGEDTPVTGALGKDVVNYKVTYKDESGKSVAKPSEKGKYTAEIAFDGNLKGTPSVTKEFEVSNGNIADIAGAIKVEDPETGKYVDPSLVYTGAARTLDADDVVFTKKGSTTTKLDEDALKGTEFTLSYSKRTADVDPETNLPVNVGTYTVTATFTGTYTGTVTGTLSVGKLNLNAGGTPNAEVQFLNADGKYDTVYSAKVQKGADGKEIAAEPTIRLAVKDGKQKTDEPTLVEPAVYKATFENNADGRDKTEDAEVHLAANAGYTGYVVTGSAAMGTFKILDNSFSDVNARLELSKNSSDFDSAKPAKFTLQLNSDIGAFVYNKLGQNGTGKVALAAGAKYTVTSTDGGTTWKWGAVCPAGVDEGDVLDATVYVPAEVVSSVTVNYQVKYDGAKWVWQDPRATGADGDAVNTDDYAVDFDGTPVENSTGEVTVVYDDLTYDNGAYKWGATAPVDDSNTEAVKTAIQDTSTYEAKTTGTVTIEKGDYEVSTVNGGASWTYKTAPNPDGVAAQGAVTSTVTGASYSDGAVSNYDYRLRVLDPDGEDVTNKVTIEGDTVDGKTVTIEGNVASGALYKAGTYTIVAGASDKGDYAGRVQAEYTINGIDIAKEGAFSFTYSVSVYDSDSDTHKTTVYTYDDDWAVSYDPTLAKKVAGITLENRTDKMGTLAVATATGTPLDAGEDKDYTVSYENNTAAGTAKVVFEGKGDYTGKVEKEFKINPLKLYDWNGDDGYAIDFDQAIYDKDTKTYRMAYTGEALTPAFTINYYEGTDANRNPVLKSTFDDEFTTAWFNNVDVYYGRTGVDDWATVQITATGNYEGTLEGSFYIDPVTLTADNATYAVADVAYTGNVAQPKATVKWNGKELAQGKDFAVDVNGATEVGSYTATIKQVDGGNFLMPASVTRDFKVTGLNLSNAEVKLAKTSVTFTGKAQKPAVESVTVDGNAVNPALYTVSYPTAKKVGTYDVTVKAKGSGVTGSAKASFQITKAANPLKVANAKRTVKAAKLKKAAQKVTGLKVSKAGKGTMTYKVTKVTKGKKTVAKKNFKVAKSSVNKLTVKKGLAKGTYKVTMTAKAKGNANYSASKVLKKVVTVVVK